jgi:hypothetical protein
MKIRMIKDIRAPAIMEEANKNRKGYGVWVAILFLRDS